MSKLRSTSAATTADYLAEAGPRLAALCTACGACFAACPMVDHVGLREANPEIVTGNLRQLAIGAVGAPDTLKWVGACTRSGLCVSSCPERERGLDAMLLVRIAKQQALVTTRQLQAKNDPTAFPRVKAFARMQLTDEEMAKWL